MDARRIEAWLREKSPEALERLWAEADRVRRENVGDEVFLRGLIEASNICRRSCGYCGIRAENGKIERYRMSRDEILECAEQARRMGYGTVVIQAGEDPGLDADFVASIVRDIKASTGLAVTLSLGEREEFELELWKAAGADRYLMRFEASKPGLFAAIHPPQAGRETCDRPALLRKLKALGYEVGSGFLVGIPGQSYADLAGDLLLCRELGLDMIGIGPFIPHPETPLGKVSAPVGEGQVPPSEAMTYKCVALARLLCPEANLPSTTALATLNLAGGRELGLRRGANILMPNLTPLKYRALYEIYPAKACVRETAEQCHACLGQRIHQIGRRIGQGAGSAPHFRRQERPGTRNGRGA